MLSYVVSILPCRVGDGDVVDSFCFELRTKESCPRAVRAPPFAHECRLPVTRPVHIWFRPFGEPLPVPGILFPSNVTMREMGRPKAAFRRR